MRPINLLPPEAFRRQSARRLRLRVALLGLLYVIGLVLLTLLWSGRVDVAEDKVLQEQAANDQLRTRVAALSDAQGLVDDYDANASLLIDALALDMSWGRVLNDLARLIPDRVWLESFAGSVNEGEEGPLGTVTVSGVGFTYPDVSAWLRSLDSERFPGVTGTWVQSVAESIIGEATTVAFSSTTALTERALSERVIGRIPEVGG